MKRALKTVSASDIRIDGGTQSRVDIDPHWVHEMVDNMKNDVEYPPIEARFDGVHYWLTDGFHRYHAYTQLGIKDIQVAYLPGTMHEAQLDALASNDKHGLNLSREDKEKKVEMALENPLLKDQSNYAIAKACRLSQSFVASIRDPKQKEKQAQSKKKHIAKKAKEAEEVEEIKEEESVTSQTSNPEVLDRPVGGDVPDEAELRANEAQREADMEAVAKFLDANDKMKHLYEENQRLLSANVGLQLRITELMNEKSAAVKMVKQLQKENEKLKGKK